MVNLEEVYDKQGEVKTGNNTAEVRWSYFALGSKTEQGESDTGGEFDVLWPSVCNGDDYQLDLSSQLDMPILQDEVDLAFSQVKKEAAAPSKDGISFQMMTVDVLRDLWLAFFGACWKSGMIPLEWLIDLKELQ